MHIRLRGFIVDRAWRTIGRNRRTLLLAVGLAVLAAALSVGTLWPKDASQVTLAQSGEARPLRPRPAADKVPHQGLNYLLALPECDADPSFALWVTTELAKYGKAVSPLAAPIAPAIAAETAPLLRASVPEGTCLSAATVGEATGWFMASADGAVYARAASVDHGRHAPETMKPGSDGAYAQAVIGSGQTSSLVVRRASLVGIVQERLVVAEFPGIAGPEDLQANADHVEGLLSLARLELAWGDTHMPAVLPDGFAPCATYARLQPAVGHVADRVTEFCDGAGDYLLTGVLQFTDGAAAERGQPVGVGTDPGRSADARGRRAVWLDRPSSVHRFLWVEGPAEFPADQLAAVLRTMPAVKLIGTQEPERGSSPAEPAHGAQDEEHPPVTLPDGPATYIVAPEDSLWTIAAAMYGDGNLWWVLRDANHISETNPMVPGQALRVPRGTWSS